MQPPLREMPVWRMGAIRYRKRLTVRAGIWDVLRYSKFHITVVYTKKLFIQKDFLFVEKNIFHSKHLKITVSVIGGL